MADIKAEDIDKALKAAEAEPKRSKSSAGAAPIAMVEGDLKRVLIQRNDDRVATEVPEHEVPILQAIYGVEQVEILDEDAGFYQLPDDAELEMARLRQKYDRRDFPVITQLYPKGAADLATELGMTNKNKGTTGKQASSFKVRPPTRAPAKKVAGK